MALVLGELAAIVGVDDRPLDEGLDKSEGKFRKFGGKLKLAGAAAGAAAAAALGAAFTEALDVDKANDKLAAQLGATPAEAQRFGKIAGDLYAGAWGDSIDQVNVALGSVVRNIDGMADASDQALHDVTASTLDLATAFDQDVGQTSRAVGKLIKTGLARDATEALDLLTRGFQTGTDEAGDLLEVASEYSTMFRELGLVGPQALGLISQGLQAGARDADTVADALKEFAIRAQDGSTASAAGFDALGLSAEKMTAAVAKGGPAAEQALGVTLDRLRAIEDPAARNAAAVALFGTKAEDLGDALFALDLDTATDQLGQVEGAAAKMGDTLNDNASTQLEAFKRSAKTALVEQLAKALPVLTAVGGFLTEHSDIVVPLVGVLAGFATVVGTVVAAQKAWAGIMLVTNAAMKAKILITGVVRGATLAWTAAQWLLNVALIANPVGLIILAIVALIAIIVLIATKTTWFQDLWGVAWGGIKAAALATGRFFRDTVWEKWILGAFNAINAGVDKTVGFFTGLPGRIGKGLSGVGGVVSAPFKSGINTIIGLVNKATGGLNALISGANKIPGVSIPTIAQIPKLAKGGIVPAVPGGMPVIAGEAGQREAIAPLSDLHQLVASAVASAMGGLGAAGTLTIILKGDGILSGIREEVQVQGGDVQVVLGGG